MPFFFKLSDLYIDYDNDQINEKWLDYVIEAANDFIGTCNEKHNEEEGVVLFIFNLVSADVSNPDDFNSESTKVFSKNVMSGSTNITKYEYQVNGKVPIENMIGYGEWEIFSKEIYERNEKYYKYFVNFLKGLYESLREKNLLTNSYIHITCTANIDSIYDNDGLYSQEFLKEKNDLKIGDYERHQKSIVGVKRRGGKSIRKKRKQKKRRSVRKLSKK
jgi:hypothetical protein